MMSAGALSVLGLSGCRSSSFFAGPDPLGSAPPLATDTQALEAVIMAESRLVALYRSAAAAMPAHTALVSGILAEHSQHLARLRTWLVVPSGTAASAPAASWPPSSPSASSSASPSASSAASPSASAGPFTLDRLRAAEQQSSLTYLQYLGDVQPGLAQLFASIAASEFTHQGVL